MQPRRLPWVYAKTIVGHGVSKQRGLIFCNPFTGGALQLFPPRKMPAAFSEISLPARPG